jgi:hypothetical protein
MAIETQSTDTAIVVKKYLQCEKSASSDNDVITKKDITTYTKQLSWSSQVTVGTIASKSIILSMPTSGSITCTDLTAKSYYAGGITGDTTIHTYFVADSLTYATLGIGGYSTSAYTNHPVVEIAGSSMNGGQLTLSKYTQYSSTSTSSTGLSTTTYTDVASTIAINFSGINIKKYTSATNTNTYNAYWPTASGSILVGSAQTPANVFQSDRLYLQNLKIGIQWNSSSYAVVDMDCGVCTVSLPTSINSINTASVTMHTGSYKTYGSWHVFISIRDSSHEYVTANASAVSINSANSGCFTVYLQRVHAGSSTTVYVEWLAVRYW